MAEQHLKDMSPRDLYAGITAVYASPGISQSDYLKVQRLAREMLRRLDRYEPIQKVYERNHHAIDSDGLEGSI
jgi:hypothetical protein